MAKGIWVDFRTYTMLSLAFPGNGAGNACWYFLMSMLSYEILAMMPEMTKW
jgi:hypothetical protein